MLRVARRIRTSSPGEVTPSQRAILVTINYYGPVTISQIAELEGVKAPSASKIVAALEHQGFVTRTGDPSDRRLSLIAATNAGVAYVESVRAAGRTWLSDQLSSLTDDDVEQLNAALPALERLLGTAR